MHHGECGQDAYGNVVQTNGTQVFTPSYTGKQLEEETGLYYFNARWYDSGTGRFMTEDPARDGENWYAYCSENPLIYTDPDGKEVRATVTIESKSPSYIGPFVSGMKAIGVITVTDTDSGKTVTGKFFSGGSPYGKFAPVGTYNILTPNKDGHYRLEAQDSHYGDDKVEGTDQGLLRLHETGRGRSFGCVSVIGDKTWSAINGLLSSTRTSTSEVESKSRNPFNTQKTETATKYGTLEVIDATQQKQVAPRSKSSGKD